MVVFTKKRQMEKTFLFSENERLSRHLSQLDKNLNFLKLSLTLLLFDLKLLDLSKYIFSECKH